MFRIIIVASLIVLTGFLFTLSLPTADGCAAVRQKDGPSISIAEESAIIVWDPVKKVQHFIRRAAFDTKSPDFGFLVPTPTLPELPLKTVEDGIFGTIDRWLLPKTVEQSRWNLDLMLNRLGCTTKMAMHKDMAPNAAVQVLHEQKVGGYDVNVLEADNAEALAKWITDHGYSADPELYEWLTPYVASKWKISAFKISQDPKTGALARTKAVRMSFKADRPFFPYREPEGKSHKEKTPPPYAGGRMLRVLFVSDVRYGGLLGASAWHATIPWSDALSDEQRKQLVKRTGVPEESVPAGAWLTTFEDRASPRPGREEVYFEPSADPSPVRPPDFVKYNDIFVPIDCAVLGVIFIGGVIAAVVRGLRCLYRLLYAIRHEPGQSGRGGQEVSPGLYEIPRGISGRG